MISRNPVHPLTYAFLSCIKNQLAVPLKDGYKHISASNSHIKNASQYCFTQSSIVYFLLHLYKVKLGRLLNALSRLLVSSTHAHNIVTLGEQWPVRHNGIPITRRLV